MRDFGSRFALAAAASAVVAVSRLLKMAATIVLFPVHFKGFERKRTSVIAGPA
jgi:hypothetical protein